MSLDILVKISQALLTPITNIFSIYLVNKNNNYKKNYDLYDRRFLIYQSVWKFVDKINTAIYQRDFYKLISEALRQFKQETEQAVSFFGQDIIEYIEEIENHAKALKINFCKKDQDKYDQSQQNKFNEEYEQDIDWFSEQYDPLRNKFIKYLKLN